MTTTDANAPGWQREEAMRGDLNTGRRVFLSTERVGRGETRFALAALFVSAIIFAGAVPFATVPLAPITAFIPAYESALVVCDLITAVLLFGQAHVLRSRALFVLACGYLFTAFIALVHALTFPGVFSPTGLLGAGTQTTAWLYMFWHGGFPLFVIAYALLKGDRRVSSAAGTPGFGGGAFATLIVAILAVAALVTGFTVVATVTGEALPVLLVGGRFTPAMTTVISSLSVLTFIALIAVWRRRARTVLDLWLMVVMCVWLFDMGLSAIFNAARYDVGWYGGRIYGLVAASALLIVLLIENGLHYTRVAQLSVALGVANKALEQLSLHDGLTGIPNRRAFDAYLAAQVAVAHRHKRTLALVLCDVDAFKAYNDTYGHQAGDDCLKQIATALQSCCRRPADMAARYGGEEFALILPDTDLAGAFVIAETAGGAVGQLRIPHSLSPAGRHISISGGVSVLLRKVETAEQLVASADRALFQAKKTGRNRMVSAVVEAELKLA